MKKKRLLCAIALVATSAYNSSAQEIYDSSPSYVSEPLPAVVESQVVEPQVVEPQVAESEYLSESYISEDCNAPIVHQHFVRSNLLRGVGKPGFFGSLDYLYWTVRDKNLEYGIAGGRGQQDDGARGDILTLEDGWDSGIRGELGYRVDCGGPEFRFRYTGFDQSVHETYLGDLRATMVSSDNGEEDDNDNINTLGTETVFPQDLATGADVVYDLDYSTFDAEIAQTLILSDVLAVQFRAGARIADINEYEQVTYTGGDFVTPYVAQERNNAQGAGMYLGSRLDWYLTRNLSIDTGFNGGLLVMSHDSRYFFDDHDDLANADGATIVTDQETRVTPYIELIAGLTQRYNIGRCTMQLSAGYQFTAYLGLTESRTFSDIYQEGQNIRVRDNLTMDGLYARLGFNF